MSIDASGTGQARGEAYATYTIVSDTLGVGTRVPVDVAWHVSGAGALGSRGDAWIYAWQADCTSGLYNALGDLYLSTTDATDATTNKSIVKYISAGTDPSFALSETLHLTNFGVYDLMVGSTFVLDVRAGFQGGGDGSSITTWYAAPQVVQGAAASVRLWTPIPATVPEPASFVLVATLAFGLVAWRRRSPGRPSSVVNPSLQGPRRPPAHPRRHPTPGPPIDLRESA